MFWNRNSSKICFCTLAIHAPYRERARRLIQSLPAQSWVVLTDGPQDFSDLEVVTIEHQPTGPMANDYLERLPATGEGRGAAAYHDKRFALLEGLKRFETAIYVDADSIVNGTIRFPRFKPGIAVLPVVEKNVSEHLATCGSWRLPSFVELARHLTGSDEILSQSNWCHETLIAITRDGRESKFFEVWSRAAEFLQTHEVFSGEGGVIGLAAAIAGWRVDYTTLIALGNAFLHEGGGPKKSQ